MHCLFGVGMVNLIATVHYKSTDTGEDAAYPVPVDAHVVTGYQLKQALLKAQIVNAAISSLSITAQAPGAAKATKLGNQDEVQHLGCMSPSSSWLDNTNVFILAIWVCVTGARGGRR